jgi:hypothetical protein
MVHAHFSSPHLRRALPFREPGLEFPVNAYTRRANIHQSSTTPNLIAKIAVSPGGQGEICLACNGGMGHVRFKSNRS